jgi:gamma-glutamylcyclotransferase (GGCT)/AIG2-like uncharacterized protein YtfP
MSSTVSGIFVYGTLRNDCIEKSDYNKTFNNGCISIPATLNGAQLYFDGYHPFIILTDNKNDIVYGQFVIPVTKTIENKIKETDIVEHESILYHRIIVDIITEPHNKDIRYNEKAYTYIKKSIDTVNYYDVKIDGGNWIHINKNYLLLTYLKNKYNKDADTLKEIVIRSNYDLRVAESLLKWIYKV